MPKKQAVLPKEKTLVSPPKILTRLGDLYTFLGYTTPPDDSVFSKFFTSYLGSRIPRYNVRGDFELSYSSLCLENLLQMKANAKTESGGETLKALFKVFCGDYSNLYSLLSLMQLMRDPEYTTPIRAWINKVLPAPKAQVIAMNKVRGALSGQETFFVAFDAAVGMAEFLCGEIAKYPRDLVYLNLPSWLPVSDYRITWNPSRPAFLIFVDLIRFWRMALSAVFEIMLTQPSLVDNIKYFYLANPKTLFNWKCIARTNKLTYPTKIIGTFTEKPNPDYKEMQEGLSAYAKVQLFTAKSKEVVYYFDKVLKRSPGSYAPEEEIYDDQPNLIRRALKVDLEPNNASLVWMGDESQNSGLVSYMKAYIETWDKLKEQSEKNGEAFTLSDPTLYREYLAKGAPPLPIDVYPPYVNEVNMPLSFNKCYFIQKEPNCNNTIVDVYLEQSRVAFKTKPSLELTAKEKQQILTDGIVMKTLYYNMGQAWKAWKDSPTLRSMLDFVYADLSVFNKQPLPNTWEHHFRNTWFGKRMALILDMVFGEYIQEVHSVSSFSSLDLKPFHKVGIEFRLSGFKDVVRMCFDHNIALPDLISSNTEFGTLKKVPLSKLTEILCKIKETPEDPSKPQVVPWETTPTSIPPEAKERVEAFLRTLALRS